MRKITLFAVMVLFAFSIKAQILNDCACWPNASWTVTGTYNSDASAFEANPTTSANFAFDDDDAGSASDDDIAAESPVLDLTSAFSGGETALVVTANYTYNFLADSLTLEYWNADTSTWVAWEAFVENDNVTTDDFCSGTKTLFTSIELDISGFTATQLSGFRYRISFLDDGGAGGAAWEWGFCVEEPNISSRAPLNIVDLELTEDFSFYPNPVIEKLSIRAKSSIDKLVVLNILGQTVKTVTPNLNQVELDFSGLNKGIYFVKASVNGLEGTFRIVKK